MDFFLVSKVKSALAGDALTTGELKSAWDGVTGTLITADYAGAFQKWIERFRKCKISVVTLSKKHSSKPNIFSMLND